MTFWSAVFGRPRPRRRLSHLSSVHRSEHGAAAVEFALVFLILILLVYGIFEFGRAYNSQLTIQHAVREGVRVYAINKDSTAAKDATEQATAGLLDLTRLTINIHPDCEAGTADGDPTSVSATYDFQFIIWPYGWNPVLTAEGVMRCGG